MAIGYACMLVGQLNTSLATCRLQNAVPDRLNTIIRSNLSALETMIDYNLQRGIFLFRISSDIIPFASHPGIAYDWKQEHGEDLARIGNKIKQAGIRVSMHPGQYTVLNSPDSRVLMGAAADLQYHSDFLDSLGVGRESKIVLHIGGVYGNKPQAADRFVENYNRLPQQVKQRLVIENDETSYSVEEVLHIAGVAGIPVIYDHLHHLLNPGFESLSTRSCIKLCSQTWEKTDGRVKLHYSQGRIGGSRGAHADTIDAREFLDFYNQLQDKNIDIMLEVKDKNLSAVKCINAILPALPVNCIEEEWARYKYLVLSKSSAIYQEMGKLLKDPDEHNALFFYEHIDRARALPEDCRAEVNAAQHVWTHLSKRASPTERKRFSKLLQGYSEGNSPIASLKKHLLKCAINHDNVNLIKSYYFFL
jgi:UV DNA damage endonuclease